MGTSPCAPERTVSRFSVEIILKAEAEISEAYLWYLARSPLAADAFRTEVLGKIDALEDNADTWPKDEDGFHFRVVARFPYTVHYDLLGTHATVLAVAHHRRMPGHWLGRGSGHGGSS